MAASCALPNMASVADQTGPMSLDEAASPEDAARSRPPVITVDNLSIGLDFEAEYQRRTVRTDAAGQRRPRFDQDNRQSRFEETLSLSADGNILGERVLLYDAMIRGGLAQDRFDESAPGFQFDEGTSPSGAIFEYDLRLQAFPAGKVSATGYASQLDDRIPRPFLPTLDRTRERYGAGLFYNDPKLPMRLTYDHLFDTLDSGSRYLQDQEEQGEDTLRYELTWQPTDDHALSLEYEYERRSDRYSGTETRFDTTRNYLSLIDVINFGPEKRSRLETLLRLEDESGDLARDTYEFAPRLRLQHTDSLWTDYRFGALEQRYGELEVATHRGDWDITHQWDDLLTSTLGFYGLQQDAKSDADVQEWGGLLNFAVTKENDLGLFSGNLAYTHSQTRYDDGRQQGIVLDESVTLRDPLPTYLAQRNIDRFSIIVRSATGVRIYLEGRDYLVIRTGEFHALKRLPTGLIVDRETVRVSYAYAAFEDLTIARDRIDMRIQQDFENGLIPYYALNWQDERIDEQPFPIGHDRNVNRHRVGAIYRRPAWSVTGEYEFNDDSIDPYQAMHLTGDVTLFQNDRHQLNSRGAASYFRFEGQRALEVRYVSLVDLGLNHRYTLAQNLESNSAALFRFQNDSLFGETQGVDLTTDVSYRIGQFTILVEAEYDMLDLPSSTDNSLALWLKVRRDIRIIGGPGG